MLRQDLRSEITVLRINVPLSFFSIDCSEVNEEHANLAQKMKDRLVQHEIETNRELNKRYVVLSKNK